MSDPTISDSPSLFTRTLNDCRELYLSSGRLCAHEYPHLISQKGDEFVRLMDDLHRALVLKVYVTVCQADRNWSDGERFLAEVLFEHLWGKRMTGDTLRQAARKAADDASKLKWYSLIRPFDRIEPLRQRIGELETVVMRIANLVARADGSLKEQEAAAIKSIQSELQHHLRQAPVDEPTQHDGLNAAAAEAIEKLQNGAEDMYSATRGGLPTKGKAISPAKKAKAEKLAPPVSLEDALAELDELIGLDRVKQEVRTLTNYLKLQKRRGEAGLPDTDMSLHMVFTGNPGTGKTTVARILGKIFGAMGILTKGHLVETDRSGLVAEYMGQTGPKAQAKINEALDGVLFIDEAYSLVSSEGQDVYGSEAIAALLKRAEDDRKRLVVILAGYPGEMDEMLKSNPGLSSRFNRVMNFEDYSPLDLARIFECLCKKNHYKLAAGTRPKLMLGLTEMHRQRDRHFGNGRAVRNLFEQAIRRMANRIADVAEITAEQLVLLESGDIEFVGLKADVNPDSPNGAARRFNVTCPKCGDSSKSRGEYLGKKVTCPKCKAEFLAEWGVPVESGASQS